MLDVVENKDNGLWYVQATEDGKTRNITACSDKVKAQNSKEFYERFLKEAKG